MSLKTICILGITASVLLILKGVFVVTLPNMVPLDTYIEIAPILETASQVFLVLNIISLTLFLIKKKHFISATLLVINFLLSEWILYKSLQIGALSFLDSDPLAWLRNLNTFTVLLVNISFIATTARKELWIRIFGYLGILILIFKWRDLSFLHSLSYPAIMAFTPQIIILIHFITNYQKLKRTIPEDTLLDDTNLSQ